MINSSSMSICSTKLDLWEISLTASNWTYTMSTKDALFAYITVCVCIFLYVSVYPFYHFCTPASTVLYFYLYSILYFHILFYCYILFYILYSIPILWTYALFHILCLKFSFYVIFFVHIFWALSLPNTASM